MFAVYEWVRELLPGVALLMERVASLVEEGAKAFPAKTGLLVLKHAAEKQPKAYDTHIRKTEDLKQALVSTRGSLDDHSVRFRS